MSGPLPAHFRVIEACGPIGHYAGRLLADLGADVVKVEPPAGDPARAYPPFLEGVPPREASLPFILLNANKRGVCLDLESAEGRASFLRLVATADVLIDDWQPDQAARLGLTDDVIEAASPGLIRASITGWGTNGPRAGWAYADIVACAMSGVMRLAGFPDGPPEQLPDLQGQRCASIVAAAGVLAALVHRGWTGEAQRVEASMQEALLMAQETAMMSADILGSDRARTGALSSLGIDLPGVGLHATSDGAVYLMAAGAAGSGFDGLLALMAEHGAAAELFEEPYASFIATSMNRNVLVELLADEERRAEVTAMLAEISGVVRRFIASRTKRWLYEEGQRHRVLAGMVSAPEDIAVSPQLAARDWWVDLDDPVRGRRVRYPGPPWRLHGTPAALRCPAPALGQHNRELLGARETPRTAEPATEHGRDVHDHRARPLDGVRVLDLSWFGAGPITTRALATLGADVVRVETAKRPDGLRVAQPRPPGATSLNVSGYFNNYNCDKRSVAIDLTTERGHELGLELVRWADIFVTNMTNRAVAKVGMDWSTVRDVNPSIIGMYQPMQGLDGPHAEFQGFGAVLSAICGVNYLAGFAANPPVGVGTNYPDYVVNPMHAAVALLAAVLHRDRTGQGQLIDMSQLESSTAALSSALFATLNSPYTYRRAGNRVLFAAPHGVFPVRASSERDGDEWLAIACLDDQQWRALARTCGHEEWADDVRFATLAARKAHEDELEALVAEWTRAQDGAGAMDRLQASGVPAGLAQRASEVLRDPHLAARRYWVRLEHAEAGVRVYDGTPFRLSKTPAGPARAAPLLGEHTREVATSILGLNDDEVDALIAEGVLA